MKKLILLLVIFVPVIVFSCKKEPITLKKATPLSAPVSNTFAAAAAAATTSSSWIHQIIPFKYSIMESIQFLDVNNGYCVGMRITPHFSSAVLKTTDGGNTWIETCLPIEGHEYSDVFFTSLSVGYVVGHIIGFPSKTLIKKTVDGGITWVQQTSPIEMGALFSVTFTSPTTGIIVGSDNGNSIILKTTDGGFTWNTKLAAVNTNCMSVDFPTTNVGYICGQGFIRLPSYIMKTNNGGETWTSQKTNIKDGVLEDIKFIDENNGFAVGYQIYDTTISDFKTPIILKTSNGGSTWTKLTLPKKNFFFQAKTVWMNDIFTIYVGGEKLIKTTNGGISWVIENTPIIQDFFVYSIYFTNPTNGYACGNNSIIKHL